MSEEYLRQKELEQQRTLETENKIVNKVEETGVKKTIKQVENSKVSILARFILVVAITGDLFGLIPVAGSFFSLFFFIFLTILYFFDARGRGFVGNKKRKIIRKIILKILLLAVEFFFSPIPGFTLEALINIYLLKKGYYKKIEEANQKIEKIKQFLS